MRAIGTSGEKVERLTKKTFMVHNTDYQEGVSPAFDRVSTAIPEPVTLGLRLFDRT
jgi:hypothetical protein